MNKTLHRKLTEKSLYAHTPATAYGDSNFLQMDVMREVNMLREAAKDLLQPRPEAVANILRLAKNF